MSLIDFDDHPHLHLKPKISKEPLGDVVPLTWYVPSVDYDLVCIHCGHRWQESFPETMTARRGWMGQIECRHPECSTVGLVVKS